MSNVSGVNHASPTTQQVESVQVQWNSTKPLECALKGIYAASAYLAFPQHPYATAIGFLMALTSGKTKSVQLQQSGSDAIEEEMARREKLVGQLVWGAVGLGVL